MSLYPILAGQHGDGRVAALAMLDTTGLPFVTVSALFTLLTS